MSTTALAADGPMCVSQEAQDALSKCDGVAMGSFVPKGDKVGVKPPQVSTDAQAKKDNKPGAPDQAMAAGQRDIRRASMKDKTQKLLISEIAQLEQLWKATSKKASDRPQLARRLAETYVELENAAFREKTEADIKKDAAAAAKAKKTLDGARASGIRYYKVIVDEYGADYPQFDEVLYYLAYEYEQGQMLDDARKVYFRIISDTPQSKYIPNAYLAFGELYFTEAQGDPSKWELARQSYAKVLEYDQATNKVWGYAQYKLAYVYWNMAEKDKLALALEGFKKVIEYSKKFAANAGIPALGNSARKDIVPVYALIGKPEGAYGFFKPLSEDGSDAKTYDMMDQLGLNYIDTGHYAEAVGLYEDLLKRDKGEKTCQYQAHIVSATQAMKGGSNKPNVRAKMDDMVKRLKEYRTGSYSEDAKLKCANVTAELLYETGAAWQIEAQGSGGQRGTGDKKTMALAAELYNLVALNFQKEEFAKFEFPRIVKDDWPSLFKVKYAMADLLYFQEDWEKCGPAFDMVVEEDPQSKEAPEAAYAAVLCYQKLYDKQHAGGSAKKGTGNLPGQKDKKGAGKADPKAELAKKELTAQQKGMTKAFSRYLCVVKPEDAKAKEQYAEVKYARARTYFEAHYWEESAAAFKDIAMNHSDLDSGIYAAQLYLESLNILGTHADPPRASCYEEMGESVPKFITLYCDGGKAAKNPDQCAMLTSIQIDILRLKAEALLKAAQTATTNSARQFEAAGNAYLELWKKYGEAPIAAGKKPEYAKMDEVLWNAAEAFQSAHLVMKSIQVRLILLDPKNGFEKGELAKKSVYKIGGNYQAIAVYDEAAKWYERYAKEFTKADKADAALSDAVVLRLGLGQDSEAIKDADDFMKLYGKAKPAETARVAFAIGAHYVEREDWDNARKRLSGAMGLIDKSAPLDVQVQAHALLGRVMVRIKSDSAAATEYNKVKALWSNPKAAADKVTGSDADGGLRKLAKALTAVGEAYFYFAEKEKKKVDAIRFPDYKGPNDKESVLKHIKTKVADWIKKKAPAIEAAEKEYLKIVELEPAPPPRWVIAAGSRVGTMWGEFVREFRAAPIPAEMKADVELRQTYYAALDDASEPQKVRAKRAFETCLGYSVKYQYFDEYSRTCEVWLSKTYKNEYHKVDEYRGSPNRLSSGLSDRSYPLDTNGKPVNPNPVLEADKADEAVDSKKSEDKKGAAPAKK
ncbi:MAG: hypothetical protein IT374_15830 [Polyangiaceae bacterium]|nr:hypothetical protein [Polyangiaceae bacterium]